MSLTPGILHTPYFNSYCSLASHKGKSSFVCKACILGWKVQSNSLPPVLNSIHSTCLRNLISVNNDESSDNINGSPFACAYCNESNIPSSQITTIFTLEWEIIDKSEQTLVASALPSVHQAIIQVSPFEFQSFSPIEYVKHYFHNSIRINF